MKKIIILFGVLIWLQTSLFGNWKENSLSQVEICSIIKQNFDDIYRLTMRMNKHFTIDDEPSIELSIMELEYWNAVLSNQNKCHYKNKTLNQRIQELLIMREEG